MTAYGTGKKNILWASALSGLAQESKKRRKKILDAVFKRRQAIKNRKIVGKNLEEAT